MAKVATKVEFYQGTVGPLFRLIRTPKQVLAHLLFIPPLFEQANQTRHHVTRSAINAYQQSIETIVFDHYGTGDSADELIDVSLAIWQQDILLQLIQIKAHSSKAIYLHLPLSAVLLLSDEILSHVDGLILLQPDFNGKRFVKQLKRLSLAANLTKGDMPKGHNAKIDRSKTVNVINNSTVEIAGYCMQQQLLDDLAGQSLDKLSVFNIDSYWFEWQAHLEALSLGRVKQQQSFLSKNNRVQIQQVDDVKFWQTTELQLADSLLKQEGSIFSQLLSTTGKC